MFENGSYARATPVLAGVINPFHEKADSAFGIRESPEQLLALRPFPRR